MPYRRGCPGEEIHLGSGCCSVGMPSPADAAGDSDDGGSLHWRRFFPGLVVLDMAVCP